MKIYIYKLELVNRLYDDAWTEEDHKAVNEHFLRLKKDFECGKVIHVGRTEDSKAGGFGLVIYYAENDEEAKAYMKNDPAIIGGQMTAVYQLYKVVFQ